MSGVPAPGTALSAVVVHWRDEEGLARLIAAWPDDAFARWDRSHLHEFTLADGTRLTTPYDETDALGEALDDGQERLSRLELGEQFVYVFDLGDDWAHLCTVGAERIDPLDELGIVPAEPLSYFGWGAIPDQYGRTWGGDDGESQPPDDPALADLPPLRSHWGRASR